MNEFFDPDQFIVDLNKNSKKNNNLKLFLIKVLIKAWAIFIIFFCQR